MADEPKESEGEVLDLTPEMEVPEVENQPEEGDHEEVVVSFGDEAAPASEDQNAEWVRNLRKQYREVVRERDELKKQVSAPQTIEVGQKPTLAECDYDEERYDREYEAWKDRKSQAERAQTEAQQAQVREAERWQAEVKAYGEQKDTLGADDFEDAEAEVLSALTDVQKSLLIRTSKDKAKLVYALGKHPQKLRELAAIKDPMDFTFALGGLAKEAKMERRKVTTTPDSEVRGSASLSGTTDKELERLEREAERTGNRSKVIAYKRKLKAQAKA